MPIQHAVGGPLLAHGPALPIHRGPGPDQPQSQAMADLLTIEGIPVRAIGLADYGRIVCAYLMVLAFLGTVVAIDYLKGGSLLPIKAWMAVFAATTLLFSRAFVIYLPRASALAGNRRPIIHRSATILDRRFFRLEYRERARTRRSWVVEERTG
jgi:hypothetical protein